MINNPTESSGYIKLIGVIGTFPATPQAAVGLSIGLTLAFVAILIATEIRPVDTFMLTPQAERSIFYLKIFIPFFSILLPALLIAWVRKQGFAKNMLSHIALSYMLGSVFAFLLTIGMQIPNLLYFKISISWGAAIYPLVTSIASLIFFICSTNIKRK